MDYGSLEKIKQFCGRLIYLQEELKKYPFFAMKKQKPIITNFAQLPLYPKLILEVNEKELSL